MQDEAAAIWGSGGDDFSPAATVVPFDPPLPLLRGPVPAGRSDDPSTGPFVLAFPDAGSWRSAFRATESKIIEQCESGARVGCSISASNKCKPPWWKNMFGVTAADFAEREQCEEREMSSCLAASKEGCIQFAKEKCLPPFQDARIAYTTLKAFDHLVLSVARGEENAKPMSACSHGETPADPPEYSVEETNYRGSVLLESDGSRGHDFKSPGSGKCEAHVGR